MQKKGILLLQGGLGNQLHQLAALSHFATSCEFKPYVYGFDAKGNSSDDLRPAYLSLDLSTWFQEGAYRNLSLNGWKESLVRGVYGINRRTGLITEINDYEVGMNLPPLFFLRGFYEDKRFISNFSDRQLALNSSHHKDSSSPIKGRIAIHIRLGDFTDFPNKNLGAPYYKSALQQAGISTDEKLDVFSDDMKTAEKILNQIGYGRLNFPERTRNLNATELLSAISVYETIIASQSTLCWWACVVATRRNPCVKVFHTWNAKLSLSSWNSVELN